MTIRIPVYRDGNVVAEALVDECDAQLANQRWHFQGGFYASTGGWPMHRRICGVPIGDPRVVHHLNEDTLDNRRANLEVCPGMSEANSRPHPKARQAVARGHATVSA